jgi:hypothetical protein
MGPRRERLKRSTHVWMHHWGVVINGLWGLLKA